ncbi:MAG: hypothetical protein KDJ29_19685 [Hyphomicrobiales bacterium]|nr:hypothetical protein [Hyphomicrobiales bacterium]
MLAGCAPSADRLTAQASAAARATAPAVERAALPDIPAADAEPCPDPGFRAGKPYGAEAARNRQALGVCRRRHDRVVRFYRALQNEHAGQGKKELSRGR